MVEQQPVGPAGSRSQGHGGGEPPLSPLADPVAAGGRVNPGAPVAGRLVLGEPTGGVDLAGEHLAPRVAGRVAVADAVARLAVALALLMDAIGLAFLLFEGRCQLGEHGAGDVAAECLE